jgi:hypothetical protein
MVAYNVQSAVDTTNDLIVAHEVSNVGTDRSQLATVAQAAKAALHSDNLDVVADRGYFKGEEIEPRPLVAIERQSGSVSDICLSGEASNAFSIAASRFTSSSSFARFSLSRVLVSSAVSDGSSPAAVWRSAVSSWLM